MALCIRCGELPAVPDYPGKICYDCWLKEWHKHLAEIAEKRAKLFEPLPADEDTQTSEAIPNQAHLSPNKTTYIWKEGRGDPDAD